MGRYVPNRGLERELGSSLGMRDLQVHVARRVAGATKQSAPYGTGRYHRSILFLVAREDGVWHALVGSSDPFWHGIEFGSVNNSTYAPLRRGLEKVVRRTKRTPR